MKKLTVGWFTLSGLAVGLLLLIGWFFSRPSVQQSLAQKMLPAGSTIGALRLTLQSVEFQELALRLADGTQLDVSKLQADFNPFAVLFQRKLKLGQLVVTGFKLRLPPPPVTAVVPAPPLPDTIQLTSFDPGLPAQPVVGDVSAAISDPFAAFDPQAVRQALHYLESFDWLVEADRIDIEGELIDAEGGIYSATLQSQQIRSQQPARLKLSVQLLAARASWPSCPKALFANIEIGFQQNSTGGFETVDLQLQAEGLDLTGQQVLAVQQNTEFTSRAGVTDVDVSLLAQLPHPQLLVDSIKDIGPLRIALNVEVQSQTDRLTLGLAKLGVWCQDTPLFNLDLEQGLEFGQPLPPQCVLLTAQVQELPLNWLTPWMPVAAELSGAPVTGELQLSTTAAGVLKIDSRQLFNLGPLTLSMSDRLCLQQLYLQFAPQLEWQPSGAVDFELQSISVMADRELLAAGQLSGRFDPVATDSSLFSALQASGDLQLDLPLAFQQPLLRQYATVVEGQLRLDWNFDSAVSDALWLQARLVGLPCDSANQESEVYQLTAAVCAAPLDPLTVNGCLSVGDLSDAATLVNYTAQFRLDPQPRPFELRLSGPRLRQADFDVLVAAFEPPAPWFTGDLRQRSPLAVAEALPSAVSASAADSTRPMLKQSDPSALWGKLAGKVDAQFDEINTKYGLKLDQFKLQARLSEHELDIKSLSFNVNGAKLAGRAGLNYSAQHDLAYQLQAELEFEQVDSRRFDAFLGPSIPLQGRFAGQLHAQGRGASVAAVVNAATLRLLIQGREGVLTAFDSNSAVQLGLGVGNLLGQVLNRPELSALAMAVPYFQNMEFEHCTLQVEGGGAQPWGIPELSFVGTSVLIHGSGQIAAGSWATLSQQPMELNLEFGAKGRLIDYLDQLDLLGPVLSPDGFRMWRHGVQLQGSLAEPDRGALMGVLKNASRAVLRPVNTKTDPSRKKNSTVDERNHEIEMGLQLLQSIFDN